MANYLEKDNGIGTEWFLKRSGNYNKDIRISLHRDELILGRGQNKGIRYTVGISRQHALLKKTCNCQWKIKDLHSVNGVFVNACKITAGRFEPIKEFDIIGLGVADATSEEYFSFILCRRLKLQQNNHEDTPQNSDQSVDESAKNKNRRNTKENSQEPSIDSKDFNEDQNLTIVHNTASKADDWVQFPKGKRKRKRKEIILISSSDERDSDIEYIPRNKSKLCKKKHIIPLESKLMGEKVPLQSALPEKAKEAYKEFSKAVEADWVQFPKGKHKRKRKQVIIISSSDESDYDIEYIPRKKSKLRKKKHIIPFDESKLMGEKVPLQSVLPEKAKEAYKEFSNSCNEINKGKINNIVQSCSPNNETLKDNRYSNSERSWHFPIQSLRNSSISDLEEAKEDRKPAIKKEFIFDLVSIKQGRDEFVDVPHGHIKKEPADISFEKTRGNENSIVQPNDQTYNVCKKEEHPCGNNKICNGNFYLGNKLNIGVGDKELNDRLVWPPEPNDWNKENVSLLETFFDIEMEDTKVQSNKEEEKESEYVKMRSKEMTSPQLKPVETKHQTAPIKLTKALPMRFRPSYVRGREEWIVERVSRNSLNNVVVSEVAYPVTENKVKASKLTSVKTSNKTESLNIAEPKSKKFKKVMGNKLRSPSIVREDVASNGLKIPSPGKSNLKVPSPEIVKHCDKRFSLANNKVQTSDKSKNEHKTRPIQRFKSRNEQFLQDLILPPNSCKKKKEAHKERDAILHAEWMCQTNDNLLKLLKIPKKKALE